jgi:hypothetical protein
MVFQKETKAKLLGLIEHLHREGVVKSLSDVQNQMEFLMLMMWPEAHPGRFDMWWKSMDEEFQQNFSELIHCQELKDKVVLILFQQL